MITSFPHNQVTINSRAATEYVIIAYRGTEGGLHTLSVQNTFQRNFAFRRLAMPPSYGKKEHHSAKSVT